MAFTGKTALITGAAGGIGSATARLLCERGIASLIVLDICTEALDALCAELAASAQAVQILPCCVDIADRHALREALQPLLNRLEKIDILVNCAGIARENEPEEYEVWQRILDVNLHGTYYVTLEALKRMPDGGRIINVSSVLGRYGRIRNTAYCTSKHALLGFTKSLALDLALRRITVNAVLPGSVDTPMFRHELMVEAAKAGMPAEQLLRTTRKKIPLRRLVESSEVAAIIGFLASDEAAAITAQSYVIDAGTMFGA